jgi:hypothetical protein
MVFRSSLRSSAPVHHCYGRLQRQPASPVFLTDYRFQSSDWLPCTSVLLTLCLYRLYLDFKIFKTSILYLQIPTNTSHSLLELCTQQLFTLSYAPRLGLVRRRINLTRLYPSPTCRAVSNAMARNGKARAGRLSGVLSATPHVKYFTCLLESPPPPYKDKARSIYCTRKRVSCLSHRRCNLFNPSTTAPV